MSSTPKLIILIGIPGSGKSRWAIGHPQYIRICPDEIRKTHFGDISDQSNSRNAWRIATGMVIATLKLSRDAVLDGTNLNELYRQELYKYLPSHKREAKVFEIKPESALSRIFKDIKEEVVRSNVPEHSIYRCYGDFLYAKRAIKKENFDSIEYIHQEDSLFRPRPPASLSIELCLLPMLPFAQEYIFPDLQPQFRTM